MRWSMRHAWLAWHLNRALFHRKEYRRCLSGREALIASNDNWRHTIIGGIITSDQVPDTRNSGYAPADGRESAIVTDLPAGNYTAIVRGVNNTTGVALVEVYDLDQ